MTKIKLAMNWFKRNKLAMSPMGVTIGRWLIQAQHGPVDIYQLMDDMEMPDINNMDNLLQEAHQYLVQQTRQSDPYNSFQNDVINAVRNLISGQMNNGGANEMAI